jgi:prolyl-tRNA synthetase
MKISNLLVKTLRETPTGAEMPSHIFLLRGGYAKPLASGLYSIFPMGKRVLTKIERIIREEMDKIGGQEMDLPLVHPKELWEESGRYYAIGAELVRFKDRANHDMVLAMTHEEAVTDLVRSVVSSYKQLPFMVYQFKLKFRDEPRARGGLVRVREFIMKDAYSFHSEEADLDMYYDKAYKAYENIFSRVGIKPVVVQSDTGIMGGKIAHEFMLEADSGEDYLILSEDGSYSANQEIAAFDRESIPQEPLPVEEVETPGKKTIENVCAFLGAEPKQTMKAVFFTGGDKLIAAFLRGDLDISEIKIKNYLSLPEVLPAEDNVIFDAGFIPGYASPVGVKDNDNLVILIDESISQGNNFIGGANKKGCHLKNLNFNRDFTSSHVGDFATARTGHKMVGSSSRLRAIKGIEIGNIFKLGTKFSSSMGAQFLDDAGKTHPIIMGCYGIGVGRLMASIIENSHDKFGPIWPKEVAPYQVHLLNIGAEKEVVEACDSLYKVLLEAGYEVLYDDRDERPGVKFKDADLWGIPVRLGISAKIIGEGLCEWKLRNETSFDKIPIKDILDKLRVFWSGL